MPTPVLPPRAAQLLAGELVRCEFPKVSKKPDAALLANELGVLTSSAVAEVVGNVALMYRPSKKKIFRI